MRDFAFQIDNFALGLTSEQAKTEAGQRYAKDMLNLRVDDNGWLRWRQNLYPSGTHGGRPNITGVAGTKNHLYVLRADGTLYIRSRDDIHDETRVAGTSGLSGRLSVVDRTSYAILVSEGTDRGFVVFPNVAVPTADTLGIDKPDDNRLLVLSGYHDENLNADEGEGLINEKTYLYRYTIATPPEYPLGRIESNPSLVTSVTLGQDAQNRAENAVIVEVPISNLQPPSFLYPARVYIYRSDALESFSAGEVDSIPYREIGFLDFPATRHNDTMNQETWSENARVEYDNDVLPAEASQIYEFGGRVFAPAGDRLVYSDTDFGTAKVWKFPKTNEVRVEHGDIHFCGAFRSVLLFGARNGLHRLTGVSAENFQPEQISQVGPVDAHSWSVVVDGLGFVGESGFYLCNGSEVVQISDKTLDEYFRGRTVIEGAVSFFQDGDILFSVTLGRNLIGDTSRETMQFVFSGGVWTRWEAPFIQTATITPDDEDAIAYYVATGEPALRRIDWNEAYSHPNRADGATMDWSWESHLIDGISEGIGRLRKRFREIELVGESEGEVTVEWWTDESATPHSKTVTLRDDLLFPTRIKVDRSGRRLALRVSGNRPVTLKNIRLEMRCRE